MTRYYLATRWRGQTCSCCILHETVTFRGRCFPGSWKPALTAGRGGKSLRRRAHPVAAENVDRGGDEQQSDADQDREQAHGHENQRDVAFGIDEPVVDRG